MGAGAKATVIGLAAAFSVACSGGGSTGGSGPAAITQNATPAIAGAVVRGVLLVGDADALAEAGIRDDVGAAQLGASLPGHDLVRSAPERVARAAFGPTPVDCVVDGTVVLSGDVATPGEYAVGDHVVADFMLCDDDQGFVFDGLLDLTVAALTGNLPGSDFDATLDLLMVDLMADDGVDALVYDGDLTFDYDVTMDPLVTIGMMGSTLRIDSADESFTLRDYVSGLEVDGNPSPAEYTFFADGRMRSSEFDGEVTYETTVDFQGLEGDPPMTGQMVITGAFGATITVDPVDDVDVDLVVDLDGNGNPDVLIQTTWAALGL